MLSQCWYASNPVTAAMTCRCWTGPWLRPVPRRAWLPPSQLGSCQASHAPVQQRVMLQWGFRTCTLKATGLWWVLNRSAAVSSFPRPVHFSAALKPRLFKKGSAASQTSLGIPPCILPGQRGCWLPAGGAVPPRNPPRWLLDPRAGALVGGGGRRGPTFPSPRPWGKPDAAREGGPWVQLQSPLPFPSLRQGPGERLRWGGGGDAGVLAGLPL